VTLGETYPFPIVDHAERRQQALDMYAEVKGTAGKPLTESPDERAAKAVKLRRGRKPSA
jgi:hypothetical protein